MVTLGVDLASQPAKTATCLVRWDGGRASIEDLTRGATDAELHQLFTRADKVGIDAPLGWPSAFVEAVSAYRRSTSWPNVDLRALRFRRTDTFVQSKTGRWPLSVSSDLIAVPAMRAVRLLAEAAAGGETIDRRGEGRFVEAYPAAALAVWGFPSTGYKGTKGAATRLTLVKGFSNRTAEWLELGVEHRHQCERSDDVFDALVASLIARAASVGLCEPIPTDAAEVASQEGWIALPRVGSLDQLGRE